MSSVTDIDLSRLSIEEVKALVASDDLTVTSKLLRSLSRDPRKGIRNLYNQIRRQQEAVRQEQQRLESMLNFEKVLWASGTERIAGVDEAGVGPLAGPVVAAAVIFPSENRQIPGVDDSKRLLPADRERLAGLINKHAMVGVGEASVEEIDRLNIYQAALLAMKRAVQQLPAEPQHLLVDAREIPGVSIPQNPFHKGDGLSYSIAAASIIAKTYRDDLMEDLDRQFPEYGFRRHKGYGTPEHQEAIQHFGPSPVHRRSYLCLKELCGECSGLFYELQEELNRATAATALGKVEKKFSRVRERLDQQEQKKLRLMFSRRWKNL